MRILITGAAGFIGSHLSRRLCRGKNEVAGLDNFNSYYSPKFKLENISDLKRRKNFKLYRTDILESRRLDRIFKYEKPEMIVHLAARAGVRPSIKFPKRYAQVNIRGTINMLEMAKKYNIKNFIFASSSSVYGERKKIPFKETDLVDNPISPYAATKKAGELLCYNYHHLYNLNCTCLRFFTVYGPAGRPDMAPYIFTEAAFKGKTIKMFGDGTSSRDYTYIDDIVKGITKATKKKIGFEIINLGNSKTVRLRDFIVLVSNLTEKKLNVQKLPLQPGDVQRTCADISKAKKILGWRPKISFKEGMQKFVHWYKRIRLS